MSVFRLCVLAFSVVILPVSAAGGAGAQTQIAQPTPPCLLWTDGCSVCKRPRGSSESQCSLSRSGQRADCVARAARCIAAEDPPAQTQIAQPTSWCLRWTDTCTICERRRDSGELKCTLSIRGRRANCPVGPARCIMADTTALKNACEEANTTREECNACSVRPDGSRMCTAILCPVKEIACVKPRT